MHHSTQLTARLLLHRTAFATAVLLCAAQFGCSDKDTPATNRGGGEARNLLLISIDTLRADHLGFHGGTRGISENLDKLAATGVVFQQTQSSSSWTLPAVASLVTSTYPSTHGVKTYRSQLDPSFETLGEILSKGGFATAGVTSHKYVSQAFGVTQGMKEFDDSLVKGNQQADLTISSPDVTARGVKLLRKFSEQDGRWFVWLHYFDPHNSYEVHEGITERLGTDDIDRYDGEIQFTDRHVGVVLDELAALGLADDTVVVLVSDHGDEFRDHKKLRHGFTLFQEVARVPFVIRAPGYGHRVIDEPVRIIDAMPTVLELLGLPRPVRIEGRSLVRAMKGERVETLPALAELELHEEWRAESVRLGRWKLYRDHTNRAQVGYALKKGGPPDDHAMEPNPPTVEEGARTLLFNLEDDPAEQTDVAAKHPTVVTELSSLLDKMLERAHQLRETGGFEAAAEKEMSAEELEHLRELGYIK